MENASTHLPLPEQITVNDEVVLRLLAENNAQELFRRWKKTGRISARGFRG